MTELHVGKEVAEHKPLSASGSPASHLQVCLVGRLGGRLLCTCSWHKTSARLSLVPHYGPARGEILTWGVGTVIGQ